MKIALDDLSGPEIARFLQDHMEDMVATSPPESRHALNLDELKLPGITFWVVRNRGTLIGCGALKKLDGDHAEIKSMRTLSAHKQRGVASKLLQHIIMEAKHTGFNRLSLETGSMPFFAPARSLYLKHGFDYCEPFADYVKDANSVFMTLKL